MYLEQYIIYARENILKAIDIKNFEKVKFALDKKIVATAILHKDIYVLD